MYNSMYPMMSPMFGMGMMGGMNGMGGDNSLMRWLYILNSSMYSLGHLGSLLSMNAHTFYHAIGSLRTSYAKLKDVIAHSAVLFWIRSKTKKSRLLRWLIIMISAYLTAKLYDLVKRLIHLEMANRSRMTTGLLSSSSYDHHGALNERSSDFQQQELQPREHSNAALDSYALV